MFLSDFSIRRPVFTVCIMLALVVLGLFSVKSLGIDQYPNTDIPTVTVSVVYPGASPESVKQDVVRKIEEAAREADSILDKHILRLAHYYWPNGSHIQTFATEARDALRAALAGGSDDDR